MSHYPRVSPIHLLSALVLLIVIFFQVFNSTQQLFDLRPVTRQDNLPIEVLRQPALESHVDQCSNTPIFYEPHGVCRPSKMALIKEAQRIAAEFEYSTAEVNRGVKAFIHQMDEGLSKKGATMSQIPTYVTAVPNGTEKVESHLLFWYNRC